jgi:PHD/YefM family antitoxin component YafN of YafNO toxin-antitoxin module
MPADEKNDVKSKAARALRTDLGSSPAKPSFLDGVEKMDLTVAREKFAEILEHVRFKKCRYALMIRKRPYAALIPIEDLARLEGSSLPPAEKSHRFHIQQKVSHLGFKCETIASNIVRDSFGEVVKSVKHNEQRLIITHHKKTAAVLVPLYDLKLLIQSAKRLAEVDPGMFERVLVSPQTEEGVGVVDHAHEIAAQRPVAGQGKRQ